MGGEGRRGSPTSLEIMPGGAPGRVVGRDLGVLVRWLGSELSFSRAGAPLLQGPETFPCDQIIVCSTLIYH